MYFRLSSNKITLLFLIFCCIAILPFVLISFYIHPHYDDYDFVNKLNGKNIFECTLYWYNTWSGRFSSIFLSNILTYGTQNIFVYRLYPIMLMALYVSSFYTLFKTLLGAQYSRIKLIFIALFFLIIYIYKMPQVTSGLYYMICSYVSSIGTIALIFLITVIVKLLDQNKNSKKTLLFFGCFLGVFIGGSYEPVMLMSMTFLFLVGIIMLLKKNVNVKWIALIGSVLFLSSLLSILADGNKVRGGENLLQSNHASIYSVLINSAISSFNLIIYTVQNPILLISLLLFIPFAVKLNKNNNVISNILNIHPILPAIGIILIAFFSFLPTTWSSLATPPRVVNQIYLFTIINFFFFMQVLVNYSIKKKVDLNFNNNVNSILKIFLILCLVPSLTNKNIGRAYGDLFTKASGYNKKMYERYNYIKSKRASGEKIISLPQLFENYTSYPLTIYYNYQELESKCSNSVNKIYAKYWEVDSIKVANTDVTEQINKLRVN